MRQPGRLSHAGGVVGDNAVFIEEIAGDKFDVAFEKIFAIDDDGFGILGAVAASHFGRDGFTIGDDGIDDAFADMSLNGAKMFAEGVVGGFAGLRHEIGNVDTGGFGTSDGASDFRDEQIGKNAGKSEPGRKKNEIGCWRAWTAKGSGRTPLGESWSLRMGTLLREILVSPCTHLPLARWRRDVRWERVEGKMRPRMARTRLETRTVFPKIAVTLVRAARKRLPKLCPRRPRPA